MFEKEAEKCASKLCCTDCKAVFCEEKCECWTFAKKGVELGYNKCKEELNKAKEIIKKFLEFVNNEDEFDSEHPQEHTNLWNELCEKAERFISEVEK